MKKILIFICVLFGLPACAPTVSPNAYSAAEAGVISRVLTGTIIAKRKVVIDNSSSVGGLAGATAGASAGTLMGNNIPTVIIGAVGGAVVGGILGSGVDKGLNQHQAYEYIIQLQDKSVISVAQTQDLLLFVKQKVRVIYGATTRVIPYNTNV